MAFPIAGSSAFEKTGSVCAALVCLVVVCFGVHAGSGTLLFRLFPERMRTLSDNDVRNTQIEITSFAFTCLMVPLYVHAAVELSGNIDSRWGDSCWSSNSGFLVTLGLMIYEEILYVIYGRDMIFHIHHLIAVVSLVSALAYPRMHFFLAMGCLVEATGFAVDPFLICRRLFSERKRPILFLGTLMWLSFLVFRIVLLPAVAAIVVSDAEADMHSSIRSLSYIYFAYVGLAFLCIFSLSSFWFYKMTIGILKQLRPSTRVVPETTAIVSDAGDSLRVHNSNAPPSIDCEAPAVNAPLNMSPHPSLRPSESADAGPDKDMAGDRPHRHLLLEHFAPSSNSLLD